jgi:hypothetical protein
MQVRDNKIQVKDNKIQVKDNTIQLNNNYLCMYPEEGCSDEKLVY